MMAWIQVIQRRVNEAVMMMIKSIKIIMLIMKITSKRNCVLTSMTRSHVKNPGNNNTEDFVDCENEKTVETENM